MGNSKNSNFFKVPLRTYHKSFLITYFGIFLAIFSQNFLEYREYFKKFCDKKSKNRAKYGVKKDL